jgi:hypothetical protein
VLIEFAGPNCFGPSYSRVIPFQGYPSFSGGPLVLAANEASIRVYRINPGAGRMVSVSSYLEPDGGGCVPLPFLQGEFAYEAELMGEFPFVPPFVVR